jgi:peptidoglycan hydrolase-like protein with peptidoglycan-binding domain
VSAKPLAQGKRTSSRTTALILTAGCCIAAGWAAAPEPLAPRAEAAAPRATEESPLSEGVGMGARPSVRVRLVQRVLDRRGFDLGPPGVDGRFGPLTAAAVRRMQARYHLVSDGIVGPRTRRVLRRIDFDRRTRADAPRERPGSRRPKASPAPANRSSHGAPGSRREPSANGPAARGRRVPAADRRRVRAARARSEADDTQWREPLLGIAAIVTLGGLAAVVAARRPGPSRTRDLMTPYVTTADGDGAAHGDGPVEPVALATAVPYGGQADGGQPQFLVDEADGAAPAWVSRSQITGAPATLEAGDPVIGYVAVGDDRGDRDRAVAAIRSWCDAAGWRLQQIVHEREPGPPTRPALAYALEQISAGRARALVATEPPPPNRSPLDPGVLLHCRRARATLVLVDPESERPAGGGGRIGSAGRLALGQEATPWPPGGGLQRGSNGYSVGNSAGHLSRPEREERPR